MDDYKKKLKQMAIKFAVHAARKVIDPPKISDWPPVCMGLFYQPKRPTPKHDSEHMKVDNEIQK